MKKLSDITLSILLLTAFSGLIFAQDLALKADQNIYPEDVGYNLSIPTPEEFLQRPLGSAPVRHHELVAYISKIVKMSDRMSLEIAGYTHEKRPVLFVIATSPDNLSNIEKIKAEHISLSEPGNSQGNITNMPVVTWLNYGVHGAESSGMDAALPTIYHLAAAEGDEIDQLLADSIILITAIFNPDGHSNRIAWLDTFSSSIPNPDPNHIEHHYDGRLARTNHYGFDLNRQWLSATQPEARAWMKKWHEWRPNVSVDYHEMGSEATYYFAPGIATRTHPLIPNEGMQLVSKVVKPAEEFMDAQKRLYFHGDRYDHFFLGKGAGFPLVNGGIGILHEASSARGVQINTSNGLRTYRENILKHFRTSIANAKGAMNHRTELLEYQKNFYKNASNRAKDHEIKAYVFNAQDDKARLYHFVELLDFHRIEVHELKENITEDNKTYRSGNAYIVPLDQPQHTLIRAMFDSIATFEDTKFYDVSTWTLPLSFGMDYAPLLNNNSVKKALGSKIKPVNPLVPEPDGPNYAYVMEWSDYYAPRALNRILSANLYAKVSLNPFSALTTRGPYNFKRGSIIVSFDRQNSDDNQIYKLMLDVAKKDGVEVHSVISGRSTIGTKGQDIGSQFNKPLKKPTILLVVGREMDWYNAGEIWHLLDYRMNMPITMTERSQLNNINFNQYTHMIYAGGRYSQYQPSYLSKIKEWVKGGGTIIGIRQGAHWIEKNILNDSKDDEQTELNSQDKAIERFAYNKKESLDPIDVIGGAIFSGDLDITHPLGFGYANRSIAVHKNTTDILPTSSNPYATVVRYNNPPVLSGYTSEANQTLLQGTAALTAERMGKGSIILFADDPNFRAIWYGTNKLFLNSLFFSQAFDPPRDN